VSPFDRAWEELMQAVRGLHAFSTGPVIPGRPVNIEVETQHLYHAAERLRRALKQERSMTQDKTLVRTVTLTFHAETPEAVDKARNVFGDYLDIGAELHNQAKRLLQAVGGDVAGVTVQVEEQ
jgi:hypothetical protein